MLTFRSSGDELLALTHAGPPFYQPPWSPTGFGMVLDDDTDWDEVAELVTESYRFAHLRSRGVGWIDDVVRSVGSETVTQWVVRRDRAAGSSLTGTRRFAATSPVIRPQ